MSDIEKLESLYNGYTGRTFDFIQNKIDVPFLMLNFDNCGYDVESTLNSVQLCVKEESEAKLSAYYFFVFYKRIHLDPQYADFVNLAAKIYIDNEIVVDDVKNNPIPKLEKCNIPDKLFVDLVSGYNFSFFFPELDRKQKYILIDKSPFTCELLKIKAKQYDLSNVEIWNKDVTQLKTTDFSAPVGILRVKNGGRYIPNFMKYIPLYKDILCSGGVFYVQESSTEREEAKKWFENLKLRFKGWDSHIEDSPTQNCMDLDSLLLVKP